MPKPTPKERYPEKLNNLIRVNEDQPEQRTEAWYANRNLMITASEVSVVLRLSQYELDLSEKGIVKLPGSKRLGTRCNKFGTEKGLIQKKCGINKPSEGNMYLKWGVKYEPVIAEIYEKSEGCELLDFGLMPHPTIEWLGASPDGITTSLRMVEIKAPLSRQIENSVPLQYWMQMQIQMEVCDLDVCDYIEVKLEEYNKEDHYLEDCYVDEDGVEQFYLESTEGLPKGTVINISQSLDDGNITETYAYPPLMEFEDEEEEKKWIVDWIADRVNNHRENAYKWIFFNHSTFSLSRFKVVKYQKIVVHRDKEWFALRKPDLEAWWNKIIEYKETGLPKKYQETPERIKKLRRKTKNDDGVCEIIESDEEDDDDNNTKTSKPSNSTVPTLDLDIEKVNLSKDVEVDTF